MDALQYALAGADAPHLPLTFPDGSRLIVLPAFGRTLGLYTPQSDRNFFWTHSALESIATTRMFLTTPGRWRNFGGDRTWVAPEREFFIRDIRRPLETYQVPPALDSGNWQVVFATDHSVMLACTAELQRLQSHDTVRVQLTKTIAPAANPLGNSKIQYAGYTQTSSIEAHMPHCAQPAQLGLWHLLQLPWPGTMWIATRGATQPRVIFGQPHIENIQTDANSVRWLMGEEQAACKISIKAEALSGRAGYLYRHDHDQYDLVIRNFEVNPSEPYVDAPWEDPVDTGYAFQACNACGSDAPFNELEYHAPAVAANSLRSKCDVSQVWAFRGGAAEIASVAAHLLGMTEPIPLFSGATA